MLPLNNIQLLNDDSPMVLQPKHIKISLKNHQKTNIYAMFKKENTTRNEIIHSVRNRKRKFNIDLNIGILGDEVGKGKTLSILGLISHDMYPSDININQNKQKIIYNSCIFLPKVLTNIITRYAFNPRNVYIKFIFNNLTKPLLKTNLIVAPHNLFQQWKQNIEQQTTLKLHLINSVKDSMDLSELLKADIVLCNSNKYNKLIRKYNNYRWSRVIFDEADSIKIPNNVHVDANFIWFVTATFRKLYKHPYIGFLKKIFRQMQKDILRKNYKVQLYGPYNKHKYQTKGISLYEKIMTHIVVQNCPQFINKSFTLPDPITYKMECSTPLYIKIIKNAIDKTTLDMLNADNISDAVTRVGSTRNLIINVITLCKNKKIDSKIKIEHYNRKLTYIHENPDIKHPTPINYFNKMIVKYTADIKTSDIKIQSIKDNIIEYDFCVKCFNNVKYPAYQVICCKINYCVKCFTECSFCDNKHKIKNFTKPTKIKKDKFSKIETLKQIIIKEGKRDKFLIFSNYNDSFQKIMLVLDELKFAYSELKGNVAVINSKLKKYATGEIKVLMLNSRHYGAGLNLQISDNIIVYHKLQDSTLEQVVGRAQR